MKILLRFVIFVATIVGVIALLIAGLYMATGSLAFLEKVGIEPTLGTLQIGPDSTPLSQETTTAADAATVLRFTWRGDEIIYNDSVVSDTEFTELLNQAKVNETKVEIVKFSDVRVEAADRWREMLDEAGVSYEVIPQE
jgi:hypothetical protein